MAFHDTRLPPDVERGAQGGPRFKTTIMALSSGLEKRNIDWQQTRGAWDIGYGIQSKEDFKEVIEFFYARQGRAHSFRFKDWADFQIGDFKTDTPQPIGQGNGNLVNFQVQKRYTSGGFTFQRPITKPVVSTARVFLNGVEQMTGWTLDPLTGILTFSNAPAALVAIQLLCEFDVPARFDTDALDINMETWEAGSIPQIAIVEVKNE